DKVDFGILLCYSGQGMVMAANKVRGIRAAFCINDEYARFARAHNDANVLVMPAGFVKFGKKMRSIIDTFLTTEFEGGRHLRRIEKIRKYESSTHRV
ncbi:MAG: RpiB/LacA/LacB family sugar-phosphate isomerase, partial [bacterium]